VGPMGARTGSGRVHRGAVRRDVGPAVVDALVRRFKHPAMWIPALATPVLVACAAAAVVTRALDMVPEFVLRQRRGLMV
jgi:hypothetical protein